MTRMLTMENVERSLPLLDEESRPFWEAGRDGLLSFVCCDGCGALLHPPQPVCRYCRSTDLGRREVPGSGVVAGVTVNHQPWDPRMPPPYAVATVVLDADPRVRLTTNLVDVDADELRVGMRVVPRFEHRGDVWIPLYVPSGEPDADLPADEIAPEDHRLRVRPMARSDRFEDRVAITGIGTSPIGRRLMRPPLSLTVEAVTAAVADAGLDLDDIDGLSTYPGTPATGGIGEGGVSALEDALGLRPTWYNGGGETFGPAGSVIAAMLAVAAGLARHVVCFRTVWQATFAARQRAAGPGGASPYGMGKHEGRVPGYSGPYGVGSAAITLALRASHHFARYGTTRAALGQIAVTQRANAALNPSAVYRDPLTMDDYLSARTISTPFGLYDCDVPADGCVAVVVSAIEAARDLPRPPVLVEAVGTQMTERIAWDQATVTHEPHTLGPAAHLWTRTSMGPDDVDVALLYDGFTFNCLSWIEALGFCKIGEAGDFLAEGRNIAREGGAIALNPHGGQLSAGRTHGMGFVHEAVVQLRGDGGERQVPGARVAVATSGGLTPAGVILLRRD
ncbi:MULTISPECIES: thiolase C-terminal domain-containing protein [Pseudofrankia]|uniref:thiolase C-terminal domain-containing protein n=1 Tax=Pseudofrankia TaxID=2994363 RepID=UPI000234B79F